MSTEQIRDAYGARSDEYVAALGSVSDMAHADATLIDTWGRRVVGRVIDAGSGPGHWTDFLRTRGLDVTGVDFVPEFVDSARQWFPESNFELGGIDNLPAKDSELGGVIAWYSLIHTHPDDSTVILREFSRALRPGGSLLVGVFEGPHASAFEHAVVKAYYWSVEALILALEAAGFESVETHTRADPGTRPHAAVIATRMN